MRKGDIVIKIPSEDTIVVPLHWMDLIEKSKRAYAEALVQNKEYTLYEVTIVIVGILHTIVGLVDLSEKNGIVVKQSVAKESDLRLATPYEIAQWKLQRMKKHGHNETDG